MCVIEICTIGSYWHDTKKTPILEGRSSCIVQRLSSRPGGLPQGLDATRVGRDAGRIAEEVISHLAGLVGTKVTVTLEIEAEIPSGAPDHVVRIVTENSRTLKFTSQGFEKE